MLAVHIVPRLGAYPLDRIDTALVDRFRCALVERGLSAKSVNNVLGVLRRLLGTAREWSLLREVPLCRPLRTVAPTIRYVPERDLQALVAAAESPWRLMILCGARTGLRFSELVELRWDDIDFDARMMHVRRANVRGIVGTTKTYRERHIPLTQDLYAALARRRAPCGLVFHCDGEFIRHAAAQDAILRASRRAAIAPVTWHMLRHTYASHLVMAGATLAAVKDLMGHSTIDMTLRYTHLSTDHLRSAVELLEHASREVWAAGGQCGETAPSSAPLTLTIRGSNPGSTQPKTLANASAL